MSEERVLPWFDGERRPWPPLEELRAQRDALRAKRHRTAQRLRTLRGLQRSALDLLTRRYELDDQTRAERDALLARVAALEAERDELLRLQVNSATNAREMVDQLAEQSESIDRLVAERDQARADAARLRAALERTRHVLRGWDRNAWDGNNIVDDDVESAGSIIETALAVGLTPNAKTPTLLGRPAGEQPT